MRRLFGMGAVFLALMAGGVAQAEEHETSGVILRRSPSELTLLSNGHRLSLALADATVVLDEFGRSLTASALRAGDSVRERCFRRPDGRQQARRITVLRRAWQELQSPEL